MFVPHVLISVMCPYLLQQALKETDHSKRYVLGMRILLNIRY